LLEAAGGGIYWAAGISVLHSSGGEGGRLKYSGTCVKNADHKIVYNGSRMYTFV